MTMAFSLKNKNRRICSAVHRAVSIRKLNSLPVNHPKPVIIVGIVDKHVRGAFFGKFNLDLHSRTITDGLSIVNTLSGNSNRD
ncbi:hypothetical protein CEN50_15425 [Fischerella thermalis CCMEE 5268]|uniref:Uncharacterized protein n=1 Tax=Fischerella thermalis CCMEE 5268 TaxID=2019662 RepID=A0A2N6KEA9_9CYAN|nr:hypothetical protein CEN50_15425 [Fischerella thermalis CCMEE 5268]